MHMNFDTFSCGVKTLFLQNGSDTHELVLELSFACIDQPSLARTISIIRSATTCCCPHARHRQARTCDVP